jgi:hypothetical protein
MVKPREEFMTAEKPSETEPVKQPDKAKAQTPEAADELDEVSLGMVTGGGGVGDTGGCLTTD